MTETTASTSSDLAYFRSISWTRAYLDNPSYTPSITIWRHYKNPENTTLHTLFSQTFKTPETIRACLSLSKKPPENQLVTEIITFMALGSGLNGHIDTAHGGTVATILDEVAGLMLRVGEDPSWDKGLPAFTAYLNVRYLRPVRTPQVVAVRAEIRGVEGRKKRVGVEIRDEGGNVLAEADSLFVRVRGGEESAERGKL